MGFHCMYFGGGGSFKKISLHTLKLFSLDIAFDFSGKRCNWVSLYLCTFLYSGFWAELYLLRYDSCNVTLSVYHDGWWWYLQFDKLLFRKHLNSNFWLLRQIFQGSTSLSVKSCLFPPEKIKLYCSAEKNWCFEQLWVLLWTWEMSAAEQVGCPAVTAVVPYQGNPLKSAAWRHLQAPILGGTLPSQGVGAFGSTPGCGKDLVSTRE